MTEVDHAAPATTRSAPATARARARAELTREIKDTARRHLATEGAAGLSLRAVARDLGMVSSAVYRYFPSRDDLLTALIVDAYDAIGAAAEAAEASRPRRDLGGRWMAICRAVRGWALDHPHEYSLIYGSPVPGYAAPTDTVDPATRVAALLLQLLRDAVDAGLDEPDDPLPARVRNDLRPMQETYATGIPARLLARGMLAWSSLFGAVGFELFGHLHNVVDDHEAYFDHQMAALGRYIGFPVKG
ncbi:MAG: TetR/AcrR family transcriptional regulator [Acidimicrobiales bacterium]